MIPSECCKMCFVALQLAAVRQGTGQAGGRFHFFSASPRESYAPYVLLTIASNNLRAWFKGVLWLAAATPQKCICLSRERTLYGIRPANELGWLPWGKLSHRPGSPYDFSRTSCICKHSAHVCLQVRQAIHGPCSTCPFLGLGVSALELLMVPKF